MNTDGSRKINEFLKFLTRISIEKSVNDVNLGRKDSKENIPIFQSSDAVHNVQFEFI